MASISNPNPTQTPPTHLYCLICKDRKPVSNATMVECPFRSKAGKEMTRCCWRATCTSCNRQVNQFAKKNKSEIPKESEIIPSK